MSTNILDNRVMGEDGYRLLETLYLLNEDIIEEHSLSEGKIGTAAFRTIEVGLRLLLDDTTGELSGILLFLPTLYKNVAEMYLTNRRIKALLNSGSPDEAKLEEYREDLCKDFVDLLNNLVLALPISGIDTMILPFVQMFDTKSIGDHSSAILVDLIESLEQRGPKIMSALSIISKPLGGGVIAQSLKFIDQLNPENINVIDTSSPTIDITPSDPDPLSLPRPGIDKDMISESHSLNRLCLLAGV